MKAWSVDLLRAVLDSVPEGIVVCEPEGEHEVLFVNEAFARLTGLAPGDLVGRNLCMLPGTEGDLEALAALRAAVAAGRAARLMLHNTRTDGTGVRSEVWVQGLRDPQGRLVCYVGHCREGAERARGSDASAPGLPSWRREDRLTGLVSRAYFEELLRRDWSVALRAQASLGFVIFDIDELGAYNDTFGRAGGDAVLRRAARLIASHFRRGSDLVARWEGGSIAVLVHDGDQDKVVGYANAVAQRMREQLIHHPRSSARYVTLSAGVATLAAKPGVAVEKLVHAAEAALERAQAALRSRPVAAAESR